MKINRYKVLTKEVLQTKVYNYDTLKITLTLHSVSQQFRLVIFFFSMCACVLMLL